MREWERREIAMLIYLQMILDPDERERFARMYLAYRNLMFTEARKLLPVVEDAEDAVHDAFLKLAKKISDIAEPVCPKTRHLVVLVVRRVAIDHLRKKGNRPADSLEEEHPAAGPDLDAASDLHRCLLRLSPSDRELLHLRYTHGYTVPECAALLTLSESAVRKREQRAKIRFAKLCRNCPAPSRTSP